MSGYSNQAHLSLDMQNREKSVEFYKKALSVLKNIRVQAPLDISYLEYEVSFLNNLGYVLLSSNEVFQGCNYYKKAIKKSTELIELKLNNSTLIKQQKNIQETLVLNDCYI